MKRILSLSSALTLMMVFFPSAAFADTTYTSTATANQEVGYVGRQQSAAGQNANGQRLTILKEGDITAMTVSADNYSAPSDLLVGIEADSSGVPSNTDLGFVTITPGEATAPPKDFTKSTNVTVHVTPGTYWIVWHTTSYNLALFWFSGGNNSTGSVSDNKLYDTSGGWVNAGSTQAARYSITVTNEVGGSASFWNQLLIVFGWGF